VWIRVRCADLIDVAALVIVGVAVDVAVVAIVVTLVVAIVVVNAVACEVTVAAVVMVAAGWQHPLQFLQPQQRCQRWNQWNAKSFLQLKGRWWGLPVTADVEVDDFSSKWKGACDVAVVEIGPTRVESHLHTRCTSVAWACCCGR
jgi:hypothetical protein